MRKERDTAILPVRIKKDLLNLVNEKVKSRGISRSISRNSWVIKCIIEGLRKHRKE